MFECARAPQYYSSDSSSYINISYYLMCKGTDWDDILSVNKKINVTHMFNVSSQLGLDTNSVVTK